MKAFELYATVELDTTKFESDVQAMEAVAKEFDRCLEDWGNHPVDYGAQAREFKRDMKSMEDAVDDVGDEFDQAARKASKVGKSVKESGVAASAFKGLCDGAIQGVSDLIRTAFDAMGEFAAASLEYVSESGSEIGNQLKQSNKEWEYTGQVMMQRVGEFLAPLLILVRDIADEILGVTNDDKINKAAVELTARQAEITKQVRENLEAIAGTFDKINVDMKKAPTMKDMMGGLESQADYWDRYNDLVTYAYDHGVDKNLLAEIANGTPESAAYLERIAEANDEEIAAMNDAYAKVVANREATAETLGGIYSEIDETCIEIKNTMESMIIEISSDSTYKFSRDVAMGYADGLKSAHPAIANWVDIIIAELGRLPSVEWAGKKVVGGGTEILNPGQELGYDYFHADGLNYVPTNDYRARLHVGEAVLTRQQADEWRASNGGGGLDMGALAETLAAVVGQSLAGVTVSMDSRTVGQLVSGTVSNKIAKQAKRKLVIA